MADDGLTDRELREQLLALGQKPGPIVATTRKQWLKKLVTLKSNAKKASKTQAPSRKLIGFSSDESEPDEAKKTVPKSGRAPRGRGGGGGRGGARSRAKNSQKDINNDDDSETSSLSHITARPPIRSSASAKDLGNNKMVDNGKGKRRSVANGNDNMAGPSLAASNRRTPAQQKITRYSSSWAKPPLNISQNIDDFDSSDSDAEDSLGPELHSMAVNTSPSLDISLPDVPSGIDFTHHRHGDSILSDDNTPQALTRRSTRTVRPRSDRNSLLSNKKQDGLSSNTQNLRRQSLRSPKSKTKANTVTDTAPESSEEETFIKHGFKVKEDPKVYKYSQYCSVLIVLVVFIFFIVLGGLYLKVRQVDKPKVCGEVGNEACPPPKDYLKKCNSKLWDYLSGIAGDVECGYVKRKHGRRVAVADVKKAVDCGKHWDAAIEEVFKNPDWKIIMYEKDLTRARKSTGVAWLESEMVQMPWMCRMKRAYDRFIFVLYMIIAGAAVIFLGVSILKYRRRRHEEANKKVFAMVEKIIDTLKQHHDAHEQNKELQPYVAILHVRDMLIPIKERKKKQPIWDEAVRFLEANESRVRVETQTISGEEFIVWRWLQGLPNGGKSKVWQGQAFGEHTSPGVKQPYSPSPCLKVRNMFDADIEYGSDWHIHVQDAILEKCAATCPDAIYHIAVDKNSTEGCVYIKCSCPEAAGKVYSALHGWWYDGNLVTVKYIRLERYYERFPYAQAAMLPMRPSNDEMKSMAQPYHRSALESS
ncbi:inner nuclear membrane protein Man1-like isoform X2 [Lineus longissimus]|uniref:inner nuclear membrane protein Man1-like isoform X2 n=1 Tax=Lineus longissimus TaxID=88925 RepID=UPI00315D1C92